MRSTRISKDLIYQEYDNDILMLEALDCYLKEGYYISRGFFLSPVIKKENEEIILSFLHIEEPSIDIKQQLNSYYQEMEIVEPDFDDTILNVLAGIRENYGYTSKYKKNHQIFDKKYKNCIVMLLDGLGVNVLEKNLDKDSFLRKHYAFSEHAIYPSTTAASTTSTVCGLTPLESGWTGWSNWIREMNREIILFNGINYYTEEKTGRTGYDFMPYAPFFEDMDIKGYVINPDFSKEKLEINDVLKESLKKLDSGYPQIQYVYFTEPDGLMHIKGTYDSSIKELLKEIDKKVEAYANKLPKDTLLVISADHGHTPVKKLDIYASKAINDCLITKISNDSRCAVFRVKEEKKKEFELLFNSLYGYVYKLYKTEDVVKRNYFGNNNDIPHKRIKDFLGNYVAIAANGYYFNHFGVKDFVFKSHHAGITKDEMEVPVIIVRK